MQPSTAVFVVGHAHWGKSLTLRALTNGNWHIHRYAIGDTTFFIRRMSNDDREDEWHDFVNDLDPAAEPHVIVAFCPTFIDENRPNVEQALEDIRGKGYRMFFWVIEQQYSTGQTITADEIEAMHRFGRVEIFRGRVEADVRARRLRSFIEGIET